jgi:hypothetical protein
VSSLEAIVRSIYALYWSLSPDSSPGGLYPVIDLGLVSSKLRKESGTRDLAEFLINFAKGGQTQQDLGSS